MFLFFKKFGKFFHQIILLRVIYFSAKHNLPLFVGLALRIELHSKRMHFKTSPINCIALSGDNFDSDIICALTESKIINLAFISRSSIKNIAAAFLPPEIDDNNYISVNASHDVAKEKYKKFILKSWNFFDPSKKIKIVLTGNFSYYAERELASALTSLSVKFIALHKENVKPPAYLDFWKKIYALRRGPFTGHSILVYNNFEKDIIVSSGVADPDKVNVVGMPRLDLLHEFRKSKFSVIANNVLFGFFTPETYMPIIRRRSHVILNGKKSHDEYIDEYNQKLTWEKLAYETLIALLQLALENKNINIYIKTKGHKYDVDYLNFVKKSQPELFNQKNIKVIHGGSALNLIMNSAVICSFNSTILLEGLAAGLPVVAPNYMEAIDEKYQQYKLNFNSAITLANNTNELKKLIKEFALKKTHNNNLSQDARQILNKYLFNLDGMASSRVRYYLENQL